MAGDGQALFGGVEQLGLEGIVSKLASSRYRSGPTTAWLKIKCFAEGEFLIIGTERGNGPTTLLLAAEQEGALTYAGSAMLTLTEAEREHFWLAVDALRIDRPFMQLKTRKGIQWMRPELHARVRFLKGEDMLRHATVRELKREPAP